VSGGIFSEDLAGIRNDALRLVGDNIADLALAELIERGGVIGC
jgi:hypothetical protein